jgi:hypothetical protein
MIAFRRAISASICLATPLASAALAGSALAQSTVTALPPGAPPPMRIAIDPKFVGTTAIQVPPPAPPKQVRLAWKYANERLIATGTPIAHGPPNTVSYARTKFRPAAIIPMGPRPINPGYRPDVVNEPTIDTSHPPSPMPAQ